MIAIDFHRYSSKRIALVPVKVRGLNEYSIPDEKSEDDALCVICCDAPRDALIMPCMHAFTCKKCIKQLTTPHCPICRTKIDKTVDVSQSDQQTTSSVASMGKYSLLHELEMERFTLSTKVKAVVEGVRKAKGKSLIFSQYSKMIEIVEWALKRMWKQEYDQENSQSKEKEAVKMKRVVKLVGSMSLQSRAAVLKAFTEEDDVTVCLLSLRAGGEGLNLQTASNVFVLEPWVSVSSSPIFLFLFLTLIQHKSGIPQLSNKPLTAHIESGKSFPLMQSVL